MTISTVAATIDHSCLYTLRKLKLSCFIFIQRPQMILFIEIGLASCLFICLILCIADFQKFSVLFRCHACVNFTTCRHIARKCKNLYFRFYNFINNIRYLIHICFGYRTHNYTFYSCSVQTSDFLNRQIKTSRLSEPVMNFSHSIKGHLILLTTTNL